MLVWFGWLGYVGWCVFVCWFVGLIGVGCMDCWFFISFWLVCWSGWMFFLLFRLRVLFGVGVFFVVGDSGIFIEAFHKSYGVFATGASPASLQEVRKLPVGWDEA